MVDYQRFARFAGALEDNPVTLRVTIVVQQGKSQTAEFAETGLGPYFRNISANACFMTSPPTCEIERVKGMSLGQTSTQFWA